MKIVKLFIIHGKEAVDGVIKDGSITEIEGDNWQENHIISLCYYLKDHYKDQPLLQQITYTHQIEGACVLFAKHGDVIFLNRTMIYHQSLEKSGTFIMPDDLTPAQQESLLLMKEMLKDFQRINICYDIEIEDGIINNAWLDSGYAKDATKVIDTYLQQQASKGKTIK